MSGNGEAVAAGQGAVSIGGQCPVHYQPLGSCCRIAVAYSHVDERGEWAHSEARSDALLAVDFARIRDTLRVRAKSTRAAAAAIGDQDSPRAAALRGKAQGLTQAADLLDALLQRAAASSSAVLGEIVGTGE